MTSISGIEHIIFSDSNNGILPHVHQNVHQIFFIMNGTVRVKIDDKEYFIDRPTAVFVSNFETHSFTAESEKFSRFCISLTPTLLRQEIKSDKLASIISNRPAHFCHCIDIEPIAPFISQLLSELIKEHERQETEFPESTSYLLRCIFIALYRHAPGAFPFDDNNISATVQRIKQKIENDLASEQSLEELAAEFHISQYYLAHAYKQVTGYSIKNYRMLCRIAEARALLTNTSLPISTISEQVGFPDTSNFSKYFRKKEGYTPSKYRQIHKGEK
ncbi:MAG: helix-turn-helix domain-containing protein [Clostridia bacterium]|nr:helix-turn-helix domain-containing protein [Clostridia bacterium]